MVQPIRSPQPGLASRRRRSNDTSTAGRRGFDYAAAPRWFPWRPLRDLWRDPLGFFARLASEQGDSCRVRLGRTDLYLLNHPDLVWELLSQRHGSVTKGRPLRKARLVLGDGLLTSEGERHQRQRRLLRPAFHHEKVAGYVACTAATALETGSRWQDRQLLEVSTEMMRLSQRIISRTLFATELDTEASVAASRALDTLVAGFGLILLPLSPLLMASPLPAAARLRGARRRLDTLIKGMIAARRKTGDRGDVLSMLLFARADDGSPAMSDELIRDEVMTLFLAGHDTTGNGLAWSWHLLAHHPEIERRWHQELDEVLEGRPPRFDDVARLQLTRQIFKEALRLYPPAPAIGRQAREDFELGGRPVRKGSILEVCPWLLHRDERFFPRADEFRPQRWTAEMEASLPRGAYFPFGLGPRFCIGRELASMIGPVVLASLGQHWRLRATMGADIVTVARSITLRPGNGLPMRLEVRTAGG